MYTLTYSNTVFPTTTYMTWGGAFFAVQATFPDMKAVLERNKTRIIHKLSDPTSRVLVYSSEEAYERGEDPVAEITGQPYYMSEKEAQETTAGAENEDVSDDDQE